MAKDYTPDTNLQGRLKEYPNNRLKIKNSNISNESDLYDRIEWLNADCFDDRFKYDRASNRRVVE